MKGYLWTENAARAEDALASLPRWEAIAVDAVGNVIEFWGFKRNQGRVWALLYLRGLPMSAGEIERELALSKGAVSMLLRDLERWGVVLRVRAPGEAAWHYRAETDLMKMVTGVLEEREAEFLSRIREDIGEAKRLAHEAKVPAAVLGRLEKMASLADQLDSALKLFLKTARLDVGGLFAVLREAAGGRAKK